MVEKPSFKPNKLKQMFSNCSSCQRWHKISGGHFLNNESLRSFFYNPRYAHQRDEWFTLHCIDDNFFCTWKSKYLKMHNIQHFSVGCARMKASYRAVAPNKSNYAIMEGMCRLQRYCICNLMCAKVNMFVRLPLKRATVLHKWFLVPYNEDSFSWLLLLAVTLPRTIF